MDEDANEDEDSEEAESEDEDGEELTPAMDAAILRTLARIKRKDPSIYESGKDVFEGQSLARTYVGMREMKAAQNRGEATDGRALLAKERGGEGMF